MKYYKDKNNAVYAYEADGSQDAYIPATYISITEQKADELRLAIAPKYVPPPQPTKEELMAKLLEIQAHLEGMQ